MKATLEDLRNRRSVRQYRPEQIRPDELDAVLEAGIWAPTGMNRQSPLLVAVQDPALRERLRQLNAAVLGKPDIDPFYGAPTIIIVFADKGVVTYLEDGSLVLGNLLNAAYALGLGACWIHRAREGFALPAGLALKKELGIDDCYEGIGHCILGYPAAGFPEAKPRKDDYIIKVL